MRKIFNKIAVATIATISFAACTDVDICTSELHPHLATVEIDYNWNGVTMNDSMIVMPYRVVNEWSSVYMCTPDGRAGHYIANRPDSVLKNEAGDELFTVKAGEMRFLTFNYNPGSSAYYYGNALSSEAIVTNDVKLLYRSYEQSSSIIQQHYNASFIVEDTVITKFVLNGDLFPAVYSQYTNIVDIKSGANSIELAPENIFNNYEFNFDISARDVTVNKVLASLSGVPYCYNMTKQKPETNNLYNVVFNVSSNGASKYTGTATILGFLRSTGSIHYTGAGILQLAIYVTDAEGNDKLYNLSINLYKYVPGMEKLQYGVDASYDIDAPIVITNEGVELSDGEASWRLLN